MMKHLSLVIITAAVIAGVTGQGLCDAIERPEMRQISGTGLRENPQALAEQLRVIGINMVFLKPAFIPHFEGWVRVGDVVNQVAQANMLDAEWISGETVIFGRKAPDAEKTALIAKVASKDPLIWCPAVRDAAASSDVELFRVALGQADIDGEHAAELARAFARGGRLAEVLMVNEALGLRLAERALADEDGEIKQNVMAALEKHGGAGAAGLIGKVIAAVGPDIMNEIDVFGALEQIGGSAAVTVLGSLLNNNAFAGNAIDGLMRIGGPEAVRTLEKVFSSEEMAEVAVQAVAEIGGPAAVQALSKVLKDERISASAIEGLARVGGTEARDALIAALDAQKDLTDLRYNLVNILRDRFEEDPVAKAAVEKADAMDRLRQEEQEGHAVPQAQDNPQEQPF
jgi:hypothetical protein